MANLIRHGDGEGEAGARSECWSIKPDGIHFDKVIGSRPQVGCCMKVGSISARSYSSQDWWLTTQVTEIIEDTPDKVVFKTKNSTYTWTT